MEVIVNDYCLNCGIFIAFGPCGLQEGTIKLPRKFIILPLFTDVTSYKYSKDIIPNDNESARHIDCLFLTTASVIPSVYYSGVPAASYGKLRVKPSCPAVGVTPRSMRGDSRGPGAKDSSERLGI
ncbi:MAG: hypothetical protein HY879_07740 [Deltaproteobacteria bacterium]|nr:hypothetical protein [Deltaproteobacteria bacterium]